MGAMWLREAGPPKAREELSALAGALARLERDERDAVILRCRQGLSPEQIARTMGISAIDAQALLLRSLGKLQRLLTQEQEEES